MEIYSELISKPIKSTLFFLADTHSEPDPANGTTSNVLQLGRLEALISMSHNAIGFCVGWSTRSFLPAPPARAGTLMTSLGNAPPACALYVVSTEPLLKRPLVAVLVLPAEFFKNVSVYGSLTSSRLNTGFSL